MLSVLCCYVLMYSCTMHLSGKWQKWEVAPESPSLRLWFSARKEQAEASQGTKSKGNGLVQCPLLHGLERGYNFWLTWKCLSITSEELEELVVNREIWAPLLRLLPAGSGQCKSKKMNILLKLMHTLWFHQMCCSAFRQQSQFVCFFKPFQTAECRWDTGTT